MAKKPTITVTGTGLATGSPDQCRINISLNHLAETADALAVTGELAIKWRPLGWTGFDGQVGCVDHAA